VVKKRKKKTEDNETNSNVQIDLIFNTDSICKLTKT